MDVSLAGGPLARGGLGLAVEDRELHAAVIDARGLVRYRYSTVIDVAEEPLGSFARSAGRVVETCRSAAAELGLDTGAVHLAVPGEIDATTNRILRAPRLGWADLPASALLVTEGADGGGSPVLVDEAAAAAHAELVVSPHPPSDFVYLHGTTGGIAGVLVLDGRVHAGASGSSRDLGHVVVDPAGLPCPCGNQGCLTQQAGPATILVDDARTDPTAPGARVLSLIADLESGQLRALRTVAEAGMYLGVALGAVARIVDPVVAVVGGAYRALLPWFLPTLRATLEVHAPSSALVRDGAIIASHVAEDAPLLGAALLSAGVPARRSPDQAPVRSAIHRPGSRTTGSSASLAAPVSTDHRPASEPRTSTGLHSPPYTRRRS